jgi:hypothetical protein
MLSAIFILVILLRPKMFDGRMLREIFGHKRIDVIGERRNYLYFSPNIIRVNKSRRMGWSRHVTSRRHKKI